MCGALGMEFVAATPPGYEAPGIEGVRDPREAVRGANVLVTDAWTSMGQEAEADRRRSDFEQYRIDSGLLALGAPDAIVLHCLPAHLGEEITPEVLYGPQSAAWDEAENRLHTEKAVLALVVE
jgi:ornithine carbamoyltransferase